MDKLKKIKPKDRTWLGKATATQRKELLNMRRLFQKGKIRLSLIAIHQTVKEMFPDVTPHLETFKVWMKETDV
jgi:hypothetical protein